MNNNERAEKRILEETVNNVSRRRKAPRHVFVILLVLYIIVTTIVSISAGSGGTIMVRGIVIPVYSFAGVFSSVANICIIFLAVYYGKVGYFTSLVVVLLQLPKIMMGIIIGHNYTSIPGVFGNILTIIAITVIYINNTRLDKYQTEIERQATTDMLTGLPNRFACHEVLSEYVKSDRRFAAVTININGFKSINDTGSDITLSINTSVRHFMKNDFTKEIRKLLDSCSIPPKQLEIEITESLMLDATDKVFQCIEEIKKMGVKLAIDDFGTGYSSLSYLNSFPADLLKIDKSFIDKMNTSDSSKQYVAAIISLGHIMGFDVISEGVEEQEQINTLRDIGCDFIQGFVWGRPLPKEEAEKLVV